MKKIVLFCMVALMGTLVFTSCQATDEKEDKALANKIEAGETLDASDYDLMIEYVGQYAEKAQKYVDMQINGTDSQEATEGMATLGEEYPYVETFRNCLKATPVDKLSAENLEKVAKYAGYVEFSAPEGYTIQTAGPENAGLEEAVPQEENGVIAGAVDTTTVSGPTR